VTGQSIPKNVQMWTRRILGKRAEDCTAPELWQVNVAIQQHNADVKTAAIVGQKAIADVEKCTAGCSVQHAGKRVLVDPLHISPDAIRWMASAHAVHRPVCPKWTDR